MLIIIYKLFAQLMKIQMVRMIATTCINLLEQRIAKKVMTSTTGYTGPG